MSISLRLAFALSCFSAFLSCASAAVNTTRTTGVSGNVSAVLLDNSAAFAVCVYPTSGTYSFLNRLLYYCTLIFSLFSRAHLWLVAGALAAALTYSGSAAVHACLLVWRGPNPFIENDSWVLYAILNSACLITVPLLNWSGTLRRLGAKAASIKDPKGKHTQSDVSTRTIVVYWAFLVLIGFICIWQQILFGADENNQEYPDLTKVMCAPGTNASLLLSPNGTYHRRAIDTQFIQENGCSNPCDQIDIPSIFRQQNDLVLLSHQKALLYNATLPGTKYLLAEELLTWENKLFDLDYYTLPFILIQGIITTLFGRRDPREIRDLIYINLFMERPLSHKPSLFRTQDILARIVAAFNYILAVAAVLVCPVFFLISLVSSELQFWDQTPDAEAPYSVGQWAPWAITCQVLLAALIARYHDKMIRFIFTTGRRILFRSSKNTDNEHDRISSAADSHDANPAHRPKLAPLQPTPPEPKPLWHQLYHQSINLYKTFAHPLNQNDQGLFDEARNFLHWCRDPQAVSRLVIRHPLRPRDARKGDGDDDDDDDGNDHDHDMRPPFGNGERDAGPMNEKRNGNGNGNADAENGRMDSGFFRGAAMQEQPPPHTRVNNVREKW